jgi:hypothetical protein
MWIHGNEPLLKHDRPLTKRKSCGRSTKDVESLNREIREAIVFDGASWGILIPKNCEKKSNTIIVGMSSKMKIII